MVWLGPTLFCVSHPTLKDGASGPQPSALPSRNIHVPAAVRFLQPAHGDPRRCSARLRVRAPSTGIGQKTLPWRHLDRLDGLYAWVHRTPQRRDLRMKRLVQRAHKALTWAACCSGLVFPLTGCDEGDDGEDDVEETAGDGDGDGGGSGDGDGDGDSSDATASEWMGSAPHLKMAGTVGGEDLSLDVAEAVAADLGTLYCE